jgi:hypothetical protein
MIMNSWAIISLTCIFLYPPLSNAATHSSLLSQALKKAISQKRIGSFLKSKQHGINSLPNRGIILGDPSASLTTNTLSTNHQKSELTITGTALFLGNIAVEGKIVNSATIALIGCSHNKGFRMIAGTIDTTAPTILSGSGFSVKKIKKSAGMIKIIFDHPFQPNVIPILLLTTHNSNNSARSIDIPTHESVTINRVSDGVLQFIIIGEENTSCSR